MLDKFLRTIANAFYLVPRQVRNFRGQHPDTEVLIADATKARRVEAHDETRYEMGWAIARRGVMILTTNGLYCGDWTIPIANIREATLLHIPGGSVLRVSTTDGVNYQFGLQRNPAWEEQKVLPLRVEHGALKFSTTALVLRLIIVGWLVYIIVQDYLRQGISVNGVFFFILLMWASLPLFRLLKFSRDR
jgi:hypothetical protein